MSHATTLMIRPVMILPPPGHLSPTIKSMRDALLCWWCWVPRFTYPHQGEMRYLIYGLCQSTSQRPPRCISDFGRSIILSIPHQKLLRLPSSPFFIYCCDGSSWASVLLHCLRSLALKFVSSFHSISDRRLVFWLCYLVCVTIALYQVLMIQPRTELRQRQ